MQIATFLLKDVFLFGSITNNSYLCNVKNKIDNNKKTDAYSPGTTLHLHKIVDGCQPIPK